MQLLNQLLKKKTADAENLEKFRDITDDVIEMEFVPFACHWDEHTIVTKNGEVMQTIKVSGSESSSVQNSVENEVDARARIREAIKTCIDSSKYGIWIHTVRRKKNLKSGGDYKRDFSGYLNHYWNDKNDWEHKFVNEVYVTIVKDGKDAKLFDPNIFMRCLFPGINNRYFNGFIDKATKELSAITSKMLPILDGCGAKLIGMEMRDGRYYSEITEFLGKLVTLREMEHPASDVNISEALTNYDVTFGFNAMEVRLRADGTRRFGAILTIKEYRELNTSVLSTVTQVPAEMIISESFEFIPAKTALKEYTRQKEILEISAANTLYDKIGLKDIIADNKGNKIDYGKSQLNFFILADSLKELEMAVANVAKALAALGMSTIREDIKIEECYWAQLPGNFEFLRRMNPVNTSRIGGFINLNDLPGGSEKSPWGHAVTTVYSATRKPHLFNFHQGNNGHTLLVGNEAAGKTVLINFLLSEARKFDNKIFFFDENRNAEIFLRSLGGEYYNPWPGGDVRPYAQTTLNPFSLEDSQDTRGFLYTWLASLISGIPLKPEFSAVCKKAITQVMPLKKEERTLNNCVNFIREADPEIADLFTPWVSGPYAELFGGMDSLAFDNNIIGFEIADVLKNKDTIAPITLYLLHRIRIALDGKPAIIVISEAYKMLAEPAVIPFLPSFLDMLTTKNALAIMAVNDSREALQSNINQTILSKTATQIYLPDEDADPAYEQAFGLSEIETSYVALMNSEDQHFLVKQDKRIAILELGISGMSDILAVLKATPEHLTIMEDVIKKQGRAHQKWMPEFLKMV